MKRSLPRILALVGGLVTTAAPAFGGPGDDALKAIRDGNARFVAGAPLHPNSGPARVADTASGQEPFVTVLTCADSRLPVELILDRGIGEVFTVRVAGNVADTDEIGTIEYGVGHLHTPLVVVMGHTSCGAVKAVCEGASVHGSIPGLVDNIIPAVERAKAKGLTGDALIAEAVRQNVWQSIGDLFGRSDEVRGLVRDQKLTVIGAVYDISTGRVEWLGEHPDQSSLVAHADGDDAHDHADVHGTPATKPGAHGQHDSPAKRGGMLTWVITAGGGVGLLAALLMATRARGVCWSVGRRVRLAVGCGTVATAGT